MDSVSQTTAYEGVYEAMQSRERKTYFYYVRTMLGVVHPQLVFDVPPSGKTSEGNAHLSPVIPGTLHVLTESDREEYKAHRAIRREAGYDYPSVLDFFRAKYPPPVVTSPIAGGENV